MACVRWKKASAYLPSFMHFSADCFRPVTVSEEAIRKQLVRVNHIAMEKDITITWSTICGAENLGDIFFSLNLGTLSPYPKCKALLAFLLLY